MDLALKILDGAEFRWARRALVMQCTVAVDWAAGTTAGPRLLGAAVAPPWSTAVGTLHSSRGLRVIECACACACACACRGAHIHRPGSGQAMTVELAKFEMKGEAYVKKVI